MDTRKRILAGDRPTGPLHLGHFTGSLRDRLRLQNTCDTFLLIADLHTLTTHPDPQEIAGLQANIEGLVLDYLSIGIDPEAVTIFLQSAVPQTSELAVLLSNLVSTARLERIPSLKEMASAAGMQAMTCGLLSYPVDERRARAHLAQSVMLQMAVRPHVVHVVGYTEAHHAASAADVIEACLLARRSIENALRGAPDMTADPQVQARKTHLVAEAQRTLEAIRSLHKASASDPLTDAACLARAVTLGIMDAPQLKNNPFGRGQVRTHIINGACQAVSANSRFASPPAATIWACT